MADPCSSASRVPPPLGRLPTTQPIPMTNSFRGIAKITMTIMNGNVKCYFLILGINAFFPVEEALFIGLKCGDGDQMEGINQSASGLAYPWSTADTFNLNEMFIRYYTTLHFVQIKGVRGALLHGLPSLGQHYLGVCNSNVFKIDINDNSLFKKITKQFLASFCKFISNFGNTNSAISDIHLLLPTLLFGLSEH